MTLPATHVIFLALATCLRSSAVAQQPSPVPTGAPLSGCSLQGKVYVCNQANLKQALAGSHIVAIASQPANHASDAALAALAKSLDKAVVSGDQAHPADLTFRLTPIEPAGVTVGPGVVDLAMLNIFIAAPGDPTASLIWSETYTGNPDMPWPSIANALTRQFKSHLGVR